jgi:ABC-type transporter Mla maintaining outer membrane lipid asymmetry ATPase subunit MlaF
MSREGLPLFLNKLLCPLLNRAAARYSDIFVDKEIQVIFDLEEGHIVPSIINLHGGKSKQAQCMGEKAWAGLITAFALREIAHPTNLLILDEPGNGLDSEGSKMFGKRISKLKDQFETILIVSHNDNICNALEGDNTVTVIKKNKISYIK